MPAALPPSAFHAVSPGFQPGYRRADCDFFLHFRFFDHFIFCISGLRPIGMFGSPDFDTPPGVSFLRTKNLFQKPDNSRIGKPADALFPKISKQTQGICDTVQPPTKRKHRSFLLCRHLTCRKYSLTELSNRRYNCEKIRWEKSDTERAPGNNSRISPFL